MKKIFSLVVILLTLFIITSCNSKKITIISPLGSPVFSTIYLKSSDKYEINLVNGVDPLVSAFSSKSHDVIIAPTNLGTKLFENSKTYVLLASIIFGNNYLVSKSSDFKLSDLEDKKITIFGKGQIPDLIFNFVVSTNEIVTSNINYVESVAEATEQFILGNTDIILSAEPNLSVLKEKIKNLSVIDLQAEYKKITNLDSYPQASIFVNNSLDNKTILNISNDFADSINKTINKPDESASLAESLGVYNFKKEIIKMSILNSNLRYVKAVDVKKELEEYFKIINIKIPDEEIYYEEKR